MNLIKIVVWVATGFFVGMLFSPLVSEMVVRLSTPSASGLP